MRRRTRRGANVVEFGLILPLFLSLYFGIMEYGWYFWTETTVVNATRAGCREGALYEVDPRDEADPTAMEVGAATITDLLVDRNINCRTGGNYFASCSISVEAQGEAPELMLSCEVDIAYSPLIGLVPTPANNEASALMYVELQ